VRRDWELAEKRRAYRRGLCRWCLGPVEKPRRTYCGDACVHEWSLRAFQSYVRKLVLRRDGGICAACGTDCVALQRDLTVVATRSATEFLERLAELGAGIERRVANMSIWSSVALLERRGGFDEKLARIRTEQATWRSQFVRTLWDADHAVSLEEGGTSELENVQTLCWKCHRQKTAEHARRRA
jgi:5-methylcytosine-specific restriction endonuclease McrA